MAPRKERSKEETAQRNINIRKGVVNSQRKRRSVGRVRGGDRLDVISEAGHRGEEVQVDPNDERVYRIKCNKNASGWCVVHDMPGSCDMCKTDYTKRTESSFQKFLDFMQMMIRGKGGDDTVVAKKKEVKKATKKGGKKC